MILEMNYMKKILTISIYVFLLMVCNTQAAEDWLMIAAVDRIESVKREISLWNLVNNVSLSKEQAEQCQALAERARASYEAYTKEIIPLTEAYEKKLKELLPLLEAGAVLVDDEKEDLMKAERPFYALQWDFFLEINAIEEELKKVLSPWQIQAITNYQPCVIPTKELADPVRIGEANENTQDYEDKLIAARTIEEASYEGFKTEIVTELIREYEVLFGYLEADELAREKEHLESIFDRARALSDEEFIYEKKDLVEEFLNKVTEFEEVYSVVVNFSKNVRGGVSALGLFFLDPHIVPILERYRQRLEKREDEALHGKMYLDNYTYAYCAEKLLLNQAQYDTIRVIITEAQNELLHIINLPREDGRNVSAELSRLHTEPMPKATSLSMRYELLNLVVPGKETSYLREKERIEKNMFDRIYPLLAKGQRAILRELSLDLLTIDMNQYKTREAL